VSSGHAEAQPFSRHAEDRESLAAENARLRAEVERLTAQLKMQREKATERVVKSTDEWRGALTRARADLARERQAREATERRATELERERDEARDIIAG
jgi:hypothetical protein